MILIQVFLLQSPHKPVCVCVALVAVPCDYTDFGPVALLRMRKSRLKRNRLSVGVAAGFPGDNTDSQVKGTRAGRRGKRKKKKTLANRRTVCDLQKENLSAFPARSTWLRQV